MRRNAAPTSKQAPPRAPSGEQHEIIFGDQRAVIVEVGGGIRSYDVGGRAVLDGYGADEMCPSGRGQILTPWPNRLEDGCYEFNERRHQVPLSEPEAHNAIHGLVRWQSFVAREREAHRVVMEYELHPQPGYPFSIVISAEYVLSNAGLAVKITATNVGRDACPWACGMHPYLSLGVAVDRLTLRVPATAVLESDARGLPGNVRSVDQTPYDFRQARTIGPTVLDHCFTRLQRDGDGLARVQLSDTTTDSRLTLWLDDRYRYLQLFTGDPLPDVARRALAVEPMTCPPNALRTGDNVTRLEPEASVSGLWGVTASLPSAR